jgi:hypothetical protein
LLYSSSLFCGLCISCINLLGFCFRDHHGFVNYFRFATRVIGLG